MNAAASPPAITPRLRQARLGVFGTFFVAGFGLAAWLVNIPPVQEKTQISHATLGILLLLLGLGGVVGMQISGFVINRLGSKIVCFAALAVFVLAVNLPVHASGAVTLGIALFVFGLGNGSLDVAMNDQAVIVEREYGRPIMSAFHAFWSIGGAVGALFGAAMQGLRLGLGTSVLAAAAVTAILGVAAIGRMLPRASVDASTASDASADSAPATSAARPQPAIRGRVIAFGVLAFLLMMAEGVANDWAPLHAVDHLQQPNATAALAYATFAVAMTVGRLTVDRIAHRFGPAFVVRYGSTAAAVGITVVMISPVFALTLVGWAIFGIGLAGDVPQLFTAAGNISSTGQSIILSRVVGAGYVGQLAGPALIGILAGWVGLNLAFVLPLLVCVIAIVVAPVVTPRPDAVSVEDAEQQPDDQLR
ncbi:MAG: MFS transporter [Microlunatus sp.]